MRPLHGRKSSPMPLLRLPLLRLPLLSYIRARSVDGCNRSKGEARRREAAEIVMGTQTACELCPRANARAAVEAVA
jgi:hypothetical protein